MVLAGGVFGKKILSIHCTWGYGLAQKRTWSYDGGVGLNFSVELGK